MPANECGEMTTRTAAAAQSGVAPPARSAYAAEVLDPLAGRMQTVLLGIAELAPLEQVADRLAEAARDLTAADFAAIGVYDRAGSLSRFVTVGISGEEVQAIGHPPSGHGLLGEFARHPALVNIEDVADHSSFSGFPDRHPPMGPFLGVPVSTGARVIGALYLTRRPGGGPFTAEDEEHIRGLAPYAAIAMSNAIRLDDERRRATAAVVLATCANAFHLADSERQVGRALVTAVEQLFPDRDYAIAYGDSALATSRLEVIQNDDELRASLETALGSDLGAGFHRVTLEPDTASQLGLQSAGEDVSVHVALRLAADEELSDVDMGVLQQLAETAAVGIAAGRRRDAEATLERYAIRDSIARDLHDDLIQSIYAIGLGMRVSSDDAAVLRGRLDTATGELNEVIRDLRAYIAQLSRGAEGLTTTGLTAMRIEALIRGHSVPQWQYSIELGQESVGPRLERQLYLIVREAVSNVHRHASATTARLTLERHEDVISLEIRDEGRGFDRRAVPEGTVGLRSLEERVADIGGSIIIDSAIGSGTTISATFPIQEDEDDGD